MKEGGSAPLTCSCTGSVWSEGGGGDCKTEKKRKMWPGKWIHMSKGFCELMDQVEQIEFNNLTWRKLISDKKNLSSGPS